MREGEAPAEPHSPRLGGSLALPEAARREPRPPGLFATPRPAAGPTEEENTLIEQLQRTEDSEEATGLDPIDGEPLAASPDEPLSKKLAHRLQDLMAFHYATFRRLS